VCQMGPTLCPTTLKDFAAAHMTLAGEEPVLSFALSLGWLILSSARPVAGMHHYWGKYGREGGAKRRYGAK
jgi:hypothetical protein